MSLDYASASTDDLVQKFADLEKQIDRMFPSGDEAADETKINALFDDLQAVITELLKRKPTDKLRGLFFHEDADVRNWAGIYLHRLNPEVAHAAATSAIYGLTTKEVLALCDRIRRGPPATPTLQQMTVPQLLARYVDACERCYGTTRFLDDEETGGPNVKDYSKTSGEIYRVAKELNARGQLAALVPLMDHPLVTVRQKAGMYCLDIASEKAAATLEAINPGKQRNDVQESSEAHTMLYLWRMGHFGAQSAASDDNLSDDRIIDWTAQYGIRKSRPHTAAAPPPLGPGNWIDAGIVVAVRIDERFVSIALSVATVSCVRGERLPPNKYFQRALTPRLRIHRLRRRNFGGWQLRYDVVGSGGHVALLDRDSADRIGK
jgi:Domain of unknown function (DUF2019)